MEVERFKERHREGYNSLLEEAFGVSLSSESAMILADSQNCFALVAMDSADTVCGGMIAEYQKDYVTNIVSYFIKYVVVRKDMRHKGVGRKLFSEIEKIAQENNVAYIEFTCADFRVESHKFYEEIGYSRKKTKVFIKEKDDYGKDG